MVGITRSKVICFYILLMNVVVSSTDLQCILFQCFGMCGYCDIADYLREWCVDDHRVFCRASNANMFDIDLAYLAFWPLGYVACPKIHCKWMNVKFSEHGMMLQASAVSPVDPGPFGGVACWQREKMQKDLKGFEFHYDSRCSTLWICWRCLNVVLICSDQALFYVVSPRRCNHPAVQRNNQQGPRLLWNRCYIFCDAICFVGSIWRFFQLISLFVSVILTDWLCLLVCVDAVDAVDGYQVTKAIEQAAGAVSGAFGGVACLHLFTFVNIETTGCILKLRSLDIKILVDMDAAILWCHIRIASDKGTPITKRYHAAVNEISGLFFSFVCFVCFYFVECCCFKHNSMSE